MFTSKLKKINSEAALLFLILLLGAILRFHGIHFGEPFKYHPDEVKLVTQAGQLLDSHFMDKDVFFAFGVYPIFYTLILSALMAGFILVALLTGYFDSLAFARVFYEQHSFTFVLLGRYLVACLGILSIYLLYRILRELYNNKTALLGAALLAVNFVHVRNSHFSTVDVPVTFFVLAAFFYIILILQRPGTRNYFLAAFFMAAAVATKYSAFLIVLPFAFVHLYMVIKSGSGIRHVVNKNLLVAKVTAIVAFLLFCPLFLLNFSRTINGLLRVQNFEKVGKIGSGGGFLSYWTGDQSPGFGVFYPNSIPATLGYVLTAFILIGVVFMIVRHRKEDIAILLFVIPTYFFFEDMSYKAMRHILPLMPFFSAAAALAIIWFCEKLFKKELAQYAAIVGILSGFIIAGSAGSLHYMNRLNDPEPRSLALHWVEQNIPAGAKIAVESFPPYLPGLFTPDSLGPGDYRIIDMNLNTRVTTLADSLVHSMRRDSVHYYIADGFTRHFFSWKYTEKRYPEITRDRKNLFRWLENNADLLADFRPLDENIQPFILIYKLK